MNLIKCYAIKPAMNMNANVFLVVILQHEQQAKHLVQDIQNQQKNEENNKWYGFYNIIQNMHSIAIGSIFKDVRTPIVI